jgi:hypothetical protein
VAYLRDRGHSEDAADELASYLQRVADSGEDAGKESAWTRIKRLLGGGSDSPSTTETEMVSLADENGAESRPQERAGRTLSERNERRMMGLHDLTLSVLRDADADGGRKPFASDPEYEYDADIEGLLDASSSLSDDPEDSGGSRDSLADLTEGGVMLSDDTRSEPLAIGGDSDGNGDGDGSRDQSDSSGLIRLSDTDDARSESIAD